MERVKIKTERLLIREFTIDMAEQVYLVSLDQDVARFVPDEVFESPEVAKKTITKLIDCYQKEQGPFVYPVILLETCKNIGYVQVINLSKGHWEVGYHITKDLTSLGYGTEALKAFIPFIRKSLLMEQLWGICHQDNKASQRILEKCGFELFETKEAKYHGSWQRIAVYRYVK